MAERTLTRRRNRRLARTRRGATRSRRRRLGLDAPAEHGIEVATVSLPPSRKPKVPLAARRSDSGHVGGVLTNEPWRLTTASTLRIEAAAELGRREGYFGAFTAGKLAGTALLAIGLGAAALKPGAAEGA